MCSSGQKFLRELTTDKNAAGEIAEKEIRRISFFVQVVDASLQHATVFNPLLIKLDSRFRPILAKRFPQDECVFIRIHNRRYQIVNEQDLREAVVRLGTVTVSGQSARSGEIAALRKSS